MQDRLSRAWRPWRLAPAVLALALFVPSVRAQETKAKTDDAPATDKANTATVPTPKEGSWMKRHEAFLDRAKEGNLDLVFLGDSITAGWGGSGKAVWERHYGPRNAANFGIGGDKTENVLWRLKNGEIDGIRPKAVVLMIGTNNSRANSAGEIAEGIEAIVKTLREALPKTKVLLLGVFPRGEKPGPAREKLAEVNARVGKLDDGQTVTYLDISRAFLNEDGTISKEVMPDFLHLSRKGYTLWADAIEPTLWKMVDEPSKSEGGGDKAN